MCSMKSVDNRYDLLWSDDTLNNSVSHYSPIDHIDHSLYMNFAYWWLLDNYHMFLDSAFENHTTEEIHFINKIIDNTFISDYFHSFHSLSFEEHYSPSLQWFFIDEEFVPHAQFTISSSLLWHFSMIFGYCLLDSIDGSDDELSWSKDDIALVERYFWFLHMFPVFAPSLLGKHKKYFADKSLLGEKVSYRSSMVGLR